MALCRQECPRFLYSYFYSVTAEVTRVVKEVVTRSEIEGKESGQPVHACV